MIGTYIVIRQYGRKVRHGSTKNDGTGPEPSRELNLHTVRSACLDEHSLLITYSFN